MGDDNGEQPKLDTITLTLQRSPWGLVIEGEVENLDLAMAMLQQAMRKVDMDLRIAAGLAAQQQHKVSAEELSRVKNILGRTPLKQ